MFKTWCYWRQLIWIKFMQALSVYHMNALRGLRSNLSQKWQDNGFMQMHCVKYLYIIGKYLYLSHFSPAIYTTTQLIFIITSKSHSSCFPQCSFFQDVYPDMYCQRKDFLDQLPATVTQIARFMGPTWGPPGPCRSQMGPTLAPRTLLSGEFFHGSCIWPMSAPLVMLIERPNRP